MPRTVTASELLSSPLTKGSTVAAKDLAVKSEPIVEEESGLAKVAKDVATQAIGGIEDVSSVLNMPFELARDITGQSAFYFTRGGPKRLTPDQVKVAREAGEIGIIPGQGAIPESNTLLGQGARFAGQAAVATGPIGAALGLIGKGTSAAATSTLGKQSVRQAIATSSEALSQNLGRGTAIEAGLGGVAGLGGGIANNFIESDLSRLVGELVAPSLIPITPTALLVRSASRLRKTFENIRFPLGAKEGGGFGFRSPFKAGAGDARARARFQRTGSAEERARGITKLDRKTTIDPDTELSVFKDSPATASEIPGALSLEKDVLSSSAELASSGDQQIAKMNQVITDSLNSIGDGGQVDDTRTAIKEGVDYLSTLMETDLLIASRAIEDRVSSLGSNATLEALNEVGDQEILKVHDHLKDQVSELYAQIKPELPVPFDKTKTWFDQLMGTVAEADKKNIPTELVAFLKDTSPDYLGKHKGNVPAGLAPRDTAVNQMVALSQQLRQTATNASKGEGQNLTKAHFAQEARKVIAEDLIDVRTSNPKDAAQVSIATQFAAKVNDHLGTPAIRKVFKRNNRDQRLVNPAVVFDQTIGLTDVRNREGLTALLRLYDLPSPASSKFQGPNVDAMKAAAEQYILKRFELHSVRNGEFNPRKAENFVASNQELLSKMPSVNAALNKTLKDGDTLALQLKRQKLQLDDIKVSKAMLLLNKGPVEAFRQIGKLGVRGMELETARLLTSISRDKTGEALSGLKTGFIEYLYSAGRQASRDALGLHHVSGFGLKEAVDKAKPIIRKMLNSEEANRLNVVVQDFIALEKRIKAKPSREGVLGDKTGKVLNVVSSIAAQKVNPVVRDLTGAPGGLVLPAALSSAFREMSHAGIVDPASKLIRDVIFDKALFKDFAQSSLTPDGELTIQAARQLNVWKDLALIHYGGTFSEPENTRQIPTASP